jgi:hypothetical protein
MKDYAELSDDTLIDLLIANTKGARWVERGVKSSKARVVSHAERKQDGDVTTAAKFADREFGPIRSRKPDPQENFQGDFLAKLDLDGKPEPNFPHDDAQPDTEPDVATHDPKRCLGKEVRSIDDLRSIALAVIRDEHKPPDGMRALRDQLRTELLAGGDPLGKCYTRLRSARATTRGGHYTYPFADC